MKTISDRYGPSIESPGELGYHALNRGPCRTLSRSSGMRRSMHAAVDPTVSTVAGPATNGGLLDTRYSTLASNTIDYWMLPDDSSMTEQRMWRDERGTE